MYARQQYSPKYFISDDLLNFLVATTNFYEPHKQVQSTFSLKILKIKLLSDNWFALCITTAQHLMYNKDNMHIPLYTRYARRPTDITAYLPSWGNSILY